MLATNQALNDERYSIIRCVEQNAAGALYEVYDNVSETNALLREIPIKLKKVVTFTEQEKLKLAFAAQAKFLTEIKHESLPRVYDYFSAIDRHYLVMESFDGDNLSGLIEKNKGAFALSDVINWADQLLGALVYLHKQSPPFFHRNINPRNIKLTSDGVIKLLGLDIVKKEDVKENSTVKNQTFNADILSYLPLEQIYEELDSASQKVITNSYDEKSELILKQPADARSDIYALGATVYHLLTARPPIDALERSIDILEGKSDPLPPASQINPKVPPEVSDVLIKAMEIKRENRFESAIIMRQILRTAFVRVKEREAREAEKQNEEIVLEFPVEQAAPAEKEQQFACRERSEIEAEQKRQTELMKQQLRESENQRLKAEQRAAEAEKRLLEKETSGENESAADTQSSSQNFIPASFQTEISFDAEKQNVETENLSEEFNDLFAEPQKNNKIWKQMSAAALVLVLLGGAVFGIINFRAFEKTLPEQATQNQITVPAETDVPEPIDETAQVPSAEQPIVETEPTPGVESTPQAETITESSAAAPELPGTQINRTPFKNKKALPILPPKIEKRPPTATKSQPKQQKVVTVDDIIGDN